MKNYKLTDEHPFTYPQLVDYCSKFYKKAFVKKLIEQALEKDSSLKEEALMANKPKTFYRDEILTVMGENDAAFKTARELYDAGVAENKKYKAGEFTRKLTNVLFGEK